MAAAHCFLYTLVLAAQIVLLQLNARRIGHDNGREGQSSAFLIRRFPKGVPVHDCVICCSVIFVSGYPPSPETLGVLELVGDFSTSLLYIR